MKKPICPYEKYHPESKLGKFKRYECKIFFKHIEFDEDFHNRSDAFSAGSCDSNYMKDCEHYHEQRKIDILKEIDKL
jgi:hypothetical protein